MINVKLLEASNDAYDICEALPYQLKKELDKVTDVMDMMYNICQDPVGSLTPQQLREAYEKQQHIYDVSDIKHELELFSEFYIEEYGIDENPMTDEEIEAAAKLLRNRLDSDADAIWSVNCKEATCIILNRREKK